MNIRDYVENPMGKGDSAIPNKKLVLNSLDAKYARLTDKKKIDMKIYKATSVRGGDEYYFHLVIPSETERDNTYDIVFHFSDHKHEHSRDLSITGYDCQIFSNCPSFAYTFAYVYNENNLLIESLKSKLSNRFYRDKPVVRNHYEIVNFDKYLYFGARYILDSKRLNKAVLDTVILKYDQKYLYSKVRTLDTIMEEYNSAKNKLTQSNRYNKAQKRKADDRNRIVPKTIQKLGSSVSAIKSAKPVEKLQSIASSRVKPVKRLKKR